MRPDRVTGPLLASFLAGPVFVSPLLLAELNRAGGAELLGIVFILFMATLIGFVLALVPNILGAALMVGLGRRWRMARHRAAWAAVGFTLGWLLAFAFSREILFAANAWLAATGLACASIVRHFTAWPD